MGSATGVGYIGALKLTPSFTFTPKPCEESILTDRCKQKLLKSGAVYDDFTPKFSCTPEEYNSEYVSFFGPGFSLPINLPGSGEGEHRTAIGRMIALRAPDKPGFNEMLISNQNKVFRHVRQAIHRYKLHFESRINRCMPDESYPLWRDAPHAKKAERVECDKTNCDIGHDFIDDKKPVVFKLKPYEKLPDGKKRGVGNLGTHRTAATAHVFSYIKEAMEGEYTSGNYTFEFVKTPAKSTLVEVFTKLLNPRKGKAYYPYFSDDCCVAAHCADGIVYFNGDIKQCDGSHYTKLLDEIRDFLANTRGQKNEHADAVNRAFAYLGRPAVFKNKNKLYKEFVKYCFTSKRMYSGFAGTTVTNNFANLIIGFCLQKRVPDPSLFTKEEYKRQYRLAAEDAGYLVKVQECNLPEDLQFLKHFPTEVDGEIVACMGLGVEVRGFAMFDGDLPGRGSYGARAKTFISEVVESRSNWGNHVLRDAMNTLVVPKTSKVLMTGVAYANTLKTLVEKSIGAADVFIPLSSLEKRYKIPACWIVDLCQLIKEAKQGELITHPAAVAFYTIDYG